MRCINQHGGVRETTGVVLRLVVCRLCLGLPFDALPCTQSSLLVPSSLPPMSLTTVVRRQADLSCCSFASCILHPALALACVCCTKRGAPPMHRDSLVEAEAMVCRSTEQYGYPASSIKADVVGRWLYPLEHCELDWLSGPSSPPLDN